MLGIVDAERVRHGGGALFHVRPRRRSGWCSATAAAAAADAGVGAAGRRRLLPRAGDDRRRRHRRPLPILLFPQLAASGWLLRTQTAFFHAAFATVVLLGLDVWRLLEGQVSGAQLFQTGLIGFGYLRDVGIAVALGRYTKASEDLAAQRGIDVANLEQVNRLIIQDMQDGVLVVDLNGVVRGHNAQVTRLLGGFGRMRGGMRLAEFSTTLHDYWRRWQEDSPRRCRRSRSSRRSGCCACGSCASARA